LKPVDTTNLLANSQEQTNKASPSPLRLLQEIIREHDAGWLIKANADQCLVQQIFERYKAHQKRIHALYLELEALLHKNYDISFVNAPGITQEDICLKYMPGIFSVHVLIHLLRLLLVERR